MGSHRERVRIRASARIQPRRKRVVNPARTRSGFPNWLNAFAIETKPEVQVTTVEVCSGALRKWRIEKSAEVKKTAIELEVS